MKRRAAPAAASAPATAPASRPAMALAMALTLALAATLASAPRPARAAPPARNLCVELREAGAVDRSAGWQVGSADARAARERPPQRLCVRNGDGAALTIDVARPVQVWQMAPGVVLPVAVPTTQWLHAGQRVEFRPRWAGGNAPVSVEIAAHASRIDPSVAPGSAEAPSRAAAGVRTTLAVPLGRWVTIASSGAATPEAGVVATRQAAPARVLELRVDLAP